MFVLSNFFTIYLYFQIGPGLTSCGFPSLLHLLLFLSAGVSFVGGFPVPGGILVFPASTHSFFMVGLLWAMGVHAEPSLICTLSGSCGLSSLRDEVQTLQIHWAPSPRVVPVVSAPSEMRCEHSLVDRHTPGGWAPCPWWCLYSQLPQR